jgi:molecular chaperone HtpG
MAATKVKKGKIGVTGENIFPIIKKFLYSDNEIFLRELVSNAVDATQKLKVLANKGEFKGELGDLTIWVKVDKKKKTLTVSDRGIGMTAEEVDKYINEIAFSSAEEFLSKYKDSAANLIGHFGLGFYSAFMVADKVEIITKSYKDDEPAVHWECDGSPEYKMGKTEKADRGTEIILHIDKDNEEYLNETRIEELLKKYCRFMPVPIAFGYEKEWKDGKEIETDKPHIINNVEPIWTKKPSELKDEDYLNFYKELYPLNEEPLFWIHLNVDYPFNLTGVLYFPKIRSNIEIQKNKIQLYSNQVFVTDSVENIVPDFLTLLHGVIDSPDIPLNVSRSYLQADQKVKKISSHITKKVADKLAEIFKNDRKKFEEKWDDLKLFIYYGMITEDKFYEKVIKLVLFKNVDGKYFTFEEYKDLIKENQKDKNGTLVFLYATNKEEQYSYISAAKEKGYDVLLLDGQLDVHFINHLEQKESGVRFVRVDSDIIDNLIDKNEDKEAKLEENEKEKLIEAFKAPLDKDADNYIISFVNGDGKGMPVTIVQNEFFRRMKDMSKVTGASGFYGDLPDSYTVVIDVNHNLFKKVKEELDKKLFSELKEEEEEISNLRKEYDELKKKYEGKDEKDIPEQDKKKMDELDKNIVAKESEIRSKVKEFAKEYPVIGEMIDLALLSIGKLKGERLERFIKRSVELIK